MPVSFAIICHEPKGVNKHFPKPYVYMESDYATKEIALDNLDLRSEPIAILKIDHDTGETEQVMNRRQIVIYLDEQERRREEERYGEQRRPDGTPVSSVYLRA